MNSAPTPEQLQLLQQEELVLETVTQALRDQHEKRLDKLHREEGRARALTAEIVRTRRDEDRALLASDEAVAHGLRSLQKDESDQLERIIEEPYFARLVVDEEINGQLKSLEYRIGLRENSECRIIDWRRAPVAKLFYEYQEGDDYSEEILGKERHGTVALRNQVGIKQSHLQSVSCRFGNFVRQGDQWINSGGPRLSGSADNTLPEIASLLSPQQYSLIESNLDRALLIQGVAGSGKTSIAIHRLAWLLGGNPPRATPERTVAVVITQSLRNYISKTLPKLGVEGVRIKTAQDWFADHVCASIPELAELHALRGEFIPRRPDTTCPSAIQRVKRSIAVLKTLEELDLKAGSVLEIFKELFSQPNRIVANDDSKLLTPELVAQVRERTLSNLQDRCVDECDDALLIRVHELLNGGLHLPDGSSGKYDHIFIDEAQDYSPVELAALMAAAKDLNCLTIVGDTGQKIDAGSSFLGWDKLKKYWSQKDEISQFVTLDLSFRSTIEIRKLADYVRGQGPSSNSGRHGRVPIWFKCLTEDRALKSAQEWLARALEKYPTNVTVVVCRNSQQAKEIASLLQPSFGNFVRFASDSQFSFDAGLVTCEVSQVRGLEFMNLLLWNPTARDYPNDDQSRNLLYLALSRARENVALISWGKSSPLLPAFSSPLVRGYDYESEEREELAAQ